MPKPAPPNRPRAGSARGGTAPGALIDDLAAERNSPPLPPEPVFTIDLVEAEAGKRGRRYVAELEEHAIRNARAAAEARRIALEQRGHLEEAARGRLAAEREISKLQRELRTALAESQRLAVRRAMPQPDPAPAVPAAPPASGKQPGGAVARSELDRTREMVEQQQRLLGERREQLVGALRERDEARLESRRAADACERAKRSLARATELLQHNALEATARAGATSPRGHDGAHDVERSGLEARVLQLTEEVERLTRHTAGLEAALEHQTDRADFAASQAATLVAEADVATEDATSARQELADAVARSTALLATISELTQRSTDLKATAEATMAELDAASSAASELERQLAVAIDERDAASSRTLELEGRLSETLEEREHATSRLVKLEDMATARDADATLATRQVAELTDRLADLETTAATTVAELEAAVGRSQELERQLAAAIDERDAASSRTLELEGRLSETLEEREHATSRLVKLEDMATARDADATLATRQVAELTDRLADLEAAAATTVAERDEAQSRVATLEELLASNEQDPDDEVLTYVDELEARLAEAEQGTAAAIAHVTELTRSADAAHAALDDLEAARAADQRRASSELERLNGRVGELEQMLAEASRPPEISDRALALEELGQLAAREPAPEQPHTSADHAALEAPAAAREERDVAVSSDLRRALLANLSELAEQPAGGTDS